MRTHYRNGDEIYLQRSGCDGCSPSTINGVFCHETDCPDAWRDELRECKWCGKEFYPNDRLQDFCDLSCWKDYSS